MAEEPRRICLTGPECTGKSAIAERAERELGVTWVREYAREYAERHDRALTAADVEPIARGQLANLDAARGALILLDTDLLSTVVYARYYYGACPRWIEDEARKRRADLYLLFDTGVPFQPDSVRDDGGATREALFDAFRAAVDEFETRWELVSGDFEERWRRVKEALGTAKQERYPREMTTSLPPSHHDYSFADYLAIERESEIKHEFDAGEILVMAGGTARHSALAVNVASVLRSTRPPGCNVFQSDMRVRIRATGRATYPDVSMVCGPLEYDPEDAARTTITNPVLLVEVLSVTTEKGDRGNKWMHYQRIPSLQEYVLVSQEPRIEIFHRMPSGTWEYSEVSEGIVRLASGPALDLTLLYADLPL